MSRDVTSIEVQKTTWKELNALKEPGDSFDDVIQRLLHGDGEDSDGGPELEGRDRVVEFDECPGGCGNPVDEEHPAQWHLENCPDL